MTRIPTIFSTGAGAPDLPCVASAEEGADAWAAEGVGEGDGTAVCPLPAQGMSSAAAHRLVPRMRLKPLDPRSSGVEFLAGCTSRWVSERAGSLSSSRKPLRRPTLDPGLRMLLCEAAFAAKHELFIVPA